MSRWSRAVSSLLAFAVLIAGEAVPGCAPAGLPTPPPFTVGPADRRTAPPTRAASPPPTTLPAVSGPRAPLPPVTGPLEGEAKTLTGAGATFPAVLYARWFDEYERLTGVKITYQAIGSGGGIKAISDQTVDFGASDGPMTDEQLKVAKGGKILHVPMALGAVVVTYNLPGVTEQLKFTPETISGIYLGSITKWNDPRLVADNPALARIDKDVVVVHRADGSGTTFIWTDYLSNVSPAWEQRVGNGTSVRWPVGLGGQGNPGVAQAVKQNAYSIGYVELIYALQNGLGVGLVKNSRGNFIQPRLETVTAAAAGVVDRIAPDLRASIVNAGGAEAYTVAGFTWQLVYGIIPDKARATALTRLLWWEIHEGQRFNADLGYAPLPKGIILLAEKKVLSIVPGAEAVLP